MTQTHVALPGTNRVPMPGARALGAVSEEEWVEVTIKVRRMAELPSVKDRPKTTMTRDELEAKHGASQGDIDTVEKAFAKYGLEVVDSDAATRTVRLGGPVSDMERAFALAD